MKSDSRPRVLFLTAGLGGLSFEQAADRLVEQASTFGLFSKLHAVKEPEILEICPRLLNWFSLVELRNTKGFGWYSWKATLAYQAMVVKRWGDFDLVMYLDAGCEMFHSVFSEKRLNKYLTHAMTSGNTLFAIPTPEMGYTKRDLFEFFPTLDVDDATNQFQSGSWIFKTESSAEFANTWESLSSLGIHMTDESLSKIPERDNFIVHRYDQSIFSLLAKSLGYQPISDVPPGNTQSIQGKIRGFFFPFWWTRNRTGKSIISIFMQRIGNVTLKF